MLAVLPRRCRVLARLRAQHTARRLQQLRAAADCGIHLGCGSTYLPEMINCDYYDHSVRDLQLDGLTFVGFADASVDLIENHHLFEHLSFDEGRLALIEWHRVLRPDGRLVMTLPDLDSVTLKWLLSTNRRRTGPSDRSTVAEMLYGSQSHSGMFHRSGYNQRSLRRVLAAAGFEVLHQLSPYPPLRSTPSMLTIARPKS